MFKRILVPIDGSQTSGNALSQALQLAARERSRITALCVIDVRVAHEARLYLPAQNEVRASPEPLSPPQGAHGYEAWARQLAARARAQGEAAGVEVRPEVVTGLPYHEIVARSPGHDLLVIGAWETSWAYPGPFLAGGTLWHVVAHTHAPVLHVTAPATKFETVLVVFDGSRAARDALHLTATWCQAWGLTLVALTIQQDGERAQAILRQAGRCAQPVVPRLVARDGDPVPAILRVASQYDCALIALGVRPHWFPGAQIPDGVTRSLLRSSPLPILLSH